MSKKEKVFVRIEEIREAIANYMRSEGCSCCEGNDHDKHRKRIAELLDVPPYEDGSGFNFYQFATKR